MTEIIASTIRPRGERILVKIYERPETSPGGIIIPRSHAEDRSWQLYEAVAASPAAEERLHLKIGEGDILRTKIGTPVDTWMVDEADGRRLFFITADAVQHVHKNTWSENND